MLYLGGGVCDVILQPAPGALQAPGTARLFLRFNSLAPNILHPPTAGSLFLPSALFPQGGERLAGDEKKKKISVGIETRSLPYSFMAFL